MGYAPGDIGHLAKHDQIDTQVAAALNEQAGRLSDASLSATYAPGTAFRKQPGVGGSGGEVVVIGKDNAVASDLGTAAVLAGGSPNYENVIGAASTANVNTAVSNLPTLTGTGASWSAIIAGYDNVVNGWACIVTGFHNKVEQTANHCTIGGGSLHSAAANAAYGTIGGGTSNKIGASTTSATVSGGFQNEGNANYCAIGGGTVNIVSGALATIAGGNASTASGQGASIGGGSAHSAEGLNSTIPGGSTNRTVGRFSTALGRESVAELEGEVTHASGRFAAAGDAQVRRLVARRLSTTATPGDMALDGGARFPDIPDNTTWTFRGLCTARTAAGESAGYEFRGVIDRNAGTTGFVGTPTVAVLAEDAAAWDFTVAAGSTGVLRLVTTGEAAKTIRWVASVEIVEVRF